MNNSHKKQQNLERKPNPLADYDPILCIITTRRAKNSIRSPQNGMLKGTLLESAPSATVRGRSRDVNSDPGTPLDMGVSSLRRVERVDHRNQPASVSIKSKFVAKRPGAGYFSS
ncbi:hypothetical protein Trydic_g2301 [Trypoxylus dichotomus]